MPEKKEKKRITIEQIVEWYKEGIAETGTPFVRWEYFVNRATKTYVGGKRRVENKLYAVIKPFTYELDEEDEKREEQDLFGGIYIGRTYLYWLLEPLKKR
jgi:hypothetical protein